MSRKLRHAMIAKIKSGQLVRSPGGNNPQQHIAEMIQWLKLVPGTDIEFMFHHGFMLLTTYRHKERKWVHRLCDSSSVHNIYVEIGEDEL